MIFIFSYSATSILVCWTTDYWQPRKIAEPFEGNRKIMGKFESNTEKVDTQKLIEHLSAKWKDRPCPMCGARQWNVQGKSFELREFLGGSLVVGGGSIIPVVPVICGNCGNTVLVNTILAGIDKRKGEKNE